MKFTQKLFLSGILMISFNANLFGNSSPAEACPKRFKTIKFVGRQIKKAVVATGNGFNQGFKTIKAEIKEQSQEDNSLAYKDDTDNKPTYINNDAW
jgi:hypothetical protein